MIEWVQKRDGRIVPFNAEKIADAIFSAAAAVGGEDRRQAEFLAGQVIHLMQQSVMAGAVPQVEAIQDLVEKVLIEHGHARTAKAFILYRNRRTRIREAKSELMDIVSEVIKDNGQHVQPSSTPAAKFRRIAAAASEEYTLSNLLPKEFASAHQRAAIHIGQLAYYSTAIDSMVVDVSLLVSRGLKMGQCQLPAPSSVSDLLRLLRVTISLAQEEIAQELLLDNLDAAFLAVNGTTHNEATDNQTCQAIKELLSDISFACYGGGQDLQVSVAVGRASSPEAEGFVELLRKACREVSAEYQGQRPHILYRVEDVDRSYNASKEQLKGCSNSSIVWDKDDSSRYFASGAKLVGNASVLTARTYVNLPRLALEAENLADFYGRIDALFSLVARQMAHRYEVLGALQSEDLPLCSSLMDTSGEAPAEALAKGLKHGNLLIIPIGLEEAQQVARLRFGASAALTAANLLALIEEICKRWSGHYALNLKLGLVPAPPVAERFLAYDGNYFPLVKALWPGRASYTTVSPSLCLETAPSGGILLPLNPKRLVLGSVCSI